MDNLKSKREDSARNKSSALRKKHYQGNAIPVEILGLQRAQVTVIQKQHTLEEAVEVLHKSKRPHSRTQRYYDLLSDIIICDDDQHVSSHLG
ncbi:hypothetical protein CHS0354_002789 [Potamilus streckersoni]|uniref:Uncharacterized protein n=1 Tax=Potamilus streckersoni TaxID=2493646 RepID=A0AAE0VYC1_9BIVA|nr:hypothetical protein CHS0354_002789 [Potamilus streckersoni]